MDFFGNLLVIAGFFIFIWSLVQLVRGIKNLKQPALRNNLLKKAGILFIVSFVLGLVGTALSPTEDTAGTNQVAIETKTKEDKANDEAKEKAEAEKQKLEVEKKAEEAKNKEKADREAQEKVKEEKEEKQKELDEANPNDSDQHTPSTQPAEVPAGQSSVVVNNNIPYFSNEDISSAEAYHHNGAFDSLGRVTVANAVIGVEIMPAEERGSISHIEPSGWNQSRYAGIGSGGWLYNRSHLIGHQLTGNDSAQNLMTGTRSFNEEMLLTENFVANYIETTENHVRYRVTPVFEGNNLVASGIYMEGLSIEDNGQGVMFNIYIPNVQPGVEINYSTGASVGPEGPASEGEVAPYNDSSSSRQSTQSSAVQGPAPAPKAEPTPTPAPVQGDISAIDTNGNGTVTIAEAEAAGYTMPIYSNHWLYPYMIDRDGDGIVGE